MLDYSNMGGGESNGPRLMIFTSSTVENRQTMAKLAV